MPAATTAPPILIENANGGQPRGEHSEFVNIPPDGLRESAVRSSTTTGWSNSAVYLQKNRSYEASAPAGGRCWN